MIWLEVAAVLAIHDRQISEHGGSSGVRDEQLVESALARPQQLVAYGDPAPDLPALAASLTYGIARNHPFVDGNKRTAFVAGLTFLGLNGAELTAAPAERFANIISLAEGMISEEDYAQWLRRNVRFETGAVHEQAANYG